MSVEHHMHCGGNKQSYGRHVWTGWWLGLGATEDLVLEAHRRLNVEDTQSEGLSIRGFKMSRVPKKVSTTSLQKIKQKKCSF